VTCQGQRASGARRVALRARKECLSRRARRNSRRAGRIRWIERQLALSVAVGVILAVAGQTLAYGYFGCKFEPPDGRVLHGAGDTPESFDKYCQAVAPHTPSMFMAYYQLQLTQGVPEFRLYLEKHPGVIPQLGVEWVEHSRGKPQGLDRAIVNGEFDRTITALARYLSHLDRPVFLRPGFEFNGPWNNYDACNYPSAFRRIVSIFRKEGAENVAFVWCFVPDGRPEFERWYPGDEWVDWWGINLFSPEHFSCELAHAFLKDAERHRKPVMICESCPRYVGTGMGSDAWNRWFAPYFRTMQQYPHIKGFCYINVDWRRRRRWMAWGDCRIEENEKLARLYKAELGRRSYIHLSPVLGSAVGYYPLPMPPTSPARGVIDIGLTPDAADQEDTR